MDFWDAIAKVLADEGGPLHSKDNTERRFDQRLWQCGGKTPAATVAARLYTNIEKEGSTSRFAQAVKRTFGLNPKMLPGMAGPTPTATNAPVKQRVSSINAAVDVPNRHHHGQPMHQARLTRAFDGFSESTSVSSTADTAATVAVDGGLAP